MILRKLSIDRINGVQTPYTVSFEQGMNIVLGPNESGKSTLARALRALLWPNLSQDGFVSASAQFEDVEGTLVVARNGPDVTWTRDGEVASAPRLPEDHLAHSLFLGLEELVDLKATQGRTVAEEIRKMMVGGYDLGLVREEFTNPTRGRFASKEAATWKNTYNELRAGEKEQEKLLRESDQLANLKEQRARCREIEKHQHFVEYARELRESCAELEEVEAALAELPQAVSATNSTDLTTLDRQVEERDAKLRVIADLEADLTIHQDAIEAASLAEPLSKLQISELGRCTKDLEESQRDLKMAEEKMGDAQAGLRSAQEAAGGREGLRVSTASGTDWIDWLGRYKELEFKQTGLGQFLTVLENQISEPESTLDDLEEGVRSLRLWLRSGAQSDSVSESDSWLNPIRVLGAIAVVSGISIATAGYELGWVLLGLGAGLIIAPYFQRAQPLVPQEGRVRAKADYPKSIREPVRWSHEEVTSRLRELNQEQALWYKHTALEQERASLAARLDGYDKSRVELKALGESLRQELGLSASASSFEIVTLTKQLQELWNRQLDAATAQEKVSSCKQGLNAQLESLCQVLKVHGCPTPLSAGEAVAATQDLTERSQQLRQALDGQSRDTKTLQQERASLVKLEGFIDEIYGRVELESGDRAGLQALVGRLPDYEGLTGRQRALQSGVTKSKTLLENAPAEISQLDDAGLDDYENHVTSKGQEGERLDKAIADIEAKLELTRNRSDQENLLARLHEALQALDARHEEAIEGLAGHFLLDRMADRHKRDQAPEVLRHARKLFAEFTQNRYELDVDQASSESFVARHLGNRTTLRPHQLSTGTRAQLLLAARLAFLESLESSCGLPLLMDEALDHSDPTRFCAITSCLAGVAAKKRQVIYLTNGPGDVLLIERTFQEKGHPQPNLIELAGDGARTVDADDWQLPLPEPRSVPAPKQQTSNEYAGVIGVPRLDLSRPAASTHVFYLLEDGLQALHSLLCEGISQVGQLRSVQRNAGQLIETAEDLLQSEVSLAKRVDLFEVFHAACSIGRGRSVTEEVLLEIPGLSSHWPTPLASLAAEGGGNAQALMKALRYGKDARSKGLRTKSIEAIEEYLIRFDYLADELSLDEDQVLARVLGDSAAADVAPRLLTSLVRRWWQYSQRSAGPKFS